jgi:hypothetical protein
MKTALEVLGLVGASWVVWMLRDYRDKLGKETTPPPAPRRIASMKDKPTGDGRVEG